jgi:hypothetical protein
LGEIGQAEIFGTIGKDREPLAGMDHDAGECEFEHACVRAALSRRRGRRVAAKALDKAPGCGVCMVVVVTRALQCPTIKLTTAVASNAGSKQ